MGKQTPKEKDKTAEVHLYKAQALAKEANNKKFRDVTVITTGVGLLMAGWTALNKRLNTIIFDARDNIAETKTVNEVAQNIWAQLVTTITPLMKDLRDVTFTDAFKSFGKEVFGKAREEISQVKGKIGTEVVEFTLSTAEKSAKDRGSFASRFQGFIKENPKKGALVISAITAAIATTFIAPVLIAKKRKNRHANTGKELAKHMKFNKSENTLSIKLTEEEANAKLSDYWQNKVESEKGLQREGALEGASR